MWLASRIAALFPSGPAAAGAPLASEPECDPACETECDQRAAGWTPQPPAIGLRETPKPTRHQPLTRHRALRADELPDMTMDRVLYLGDGCVGYDGNLVPLDASQPIAEHARRLLAWFNRAEQWAWLDDPPIWRGAVGPGLFAFQLEDAYYRLCLEQWLHPYRWVGVGGVAEHVGRLLRRKRGWATRYAWCRWPDGEQSRRVFYPLSEPILAAALAPRAVRSVARRSIPAAPVRQAA